MDFTTGYHQQLQHINALLEGTPEGPERDELNSLKLNIEELLLLTQPSSTSPSLEEGGQISSPSSKCKDASNNHTASTSDPFDEEYALFMAEISKESDETSVTKAQTNMEELRKLKELEGQRFKAPYQHQWGQLAYHNAMICSVPDAVEDITKLMVKVLFLNPTHQKMMPCPYLFDIDKDCRFSDDQCKYSHGELVPYSSLQDYMEPKFEDIAVGWKVLAMQSDRLWYKAKISKIFERQCLVSFDTPNQEGELHEKIVFEHIFPLEQPEQDETRSESEEDSNQGEGEEDEITCLKAKEHRDELINRSLMIAPDKAPLGEWEKHTRGIGSKLMQKMGYIVGTGLGKDGSGIIKPVPALIFPQGKSLDFCMNLKEEKMNPLLFHAHSDSNLRKGNKHKQKATKRAKKSVKVEQMQLEQYVSWCVKRGEVPLEHLKKDGALLRTKIKNASVKDIGIVNFKIEQKIASISTDIEDFKVNIRRLEDQHQEPKALYKKLRYAESALKQFNALAQMVQNELDRRKTNKEMSVF